MCVCVTYTSTRWCAQEQGWQIRSVTPSSNMVAQDLKWGSCLFIKGSPHWAICSPWLLWLLWIVISFDSSNHDLHLMLFKREKRHTARNKEWSWLTCVLLSSCPRKEYELAQTELVLAVSSQEIAYFRTQQGEVISSERNSGMINIIPRAGALSWQQEHTNSLDSPSSLEVWL